MEIKILSFGTAESLDLRCILEGMYRKVGKVESVEFPDEHTTQLNIHADFYYDNEYGIHEMVRMSPRSSDGNPRRSHVMVEIDGRVRESIVCLYRFTPTYLARNYMNSRETTDLMAVLGGNPLGFRRATERAMMEYSFAGELG